MSLTTESSLPGKTYIPIRIIYGVGSAEIYNINTQKSIALTNAAISQALATPEQEAIRLGAMGVPGVQLSMCEMSSRFIATAMGTAIKF